MTTAFEISVVVPAFREEAKLAENLRQIHRVIEPLASFELIVIDDGSPDGTWQVLCQLQDELSMLRAFRLSRNFGKEAAIMAGLEVSRGDAVILMDADLQHPPELIPEMLKLWRDDGFEIVNAVKRSRGTESWLKRGLSLTYYKWFQRLSGIDVGNASDYKLLDRRVVDALNQLPERQTFLRGLVAWLGYRQTRIPFDVAERQGGTSSWSTWKLMVLAINSIASFSVAPMHLITAMGLGFFGFAAVLGAQTLWVWASGEAVEGFTTVILLLIFIGAILMIGLGVIGVYISKIYDEVKGRPRFIVRDQMVSRRVDRDRIQKDQTAQPVSLVQRKR